REPAPSAAALLSPHRQDPAWGVRKIFPPPAPPWAPGRSTLVRSHRRAPGRGGPARPPAGNGRRLLRPRARLAASPAPLARSPLGGARFRLSARRISLRAGPRRALGCLGDGIGSRLLQERWMKQWLLKSEPDSFSIDDLAARPKQTTAWDGVRNYQARNMLREMKQGETAFFYHSSCDVPGIAGIVRVVKEGYPDKTAFDPKDDHYDAQSNTSDPRWF